MTATATQTDNTAIAPGRPVVCVICSWVFQPYEYRYYKDYMVADGTVMGRLGPYCKQCIVTTATEDT